MEIYAVELKNLAMIIHGLIANALKMETSDMKELFEEGYQGMRIYYYPPCWLSPSFGSSGPNHAPSTQ